MSFEVVSKSVGNRRNANFGREETIENAPWSVNRAELLVLFHGVEIDDGRAAVLSPVPGKFSAVHCSVITVDCHWVLPFAVLSSGRIAQYKLTKTGGMETSSVRHDFSLRALDHDDFYGKVGVHGLTLAAPFRKSPRIDSSNYITSHVGPKNHIVLRPAGSVRFMDYHIKHSFGWAWSHIQ